MIHDNITASRHFINKDGSREVSFFVEMDEKSGANLIIEKINGGSEKTFVVTHISLEALKSLAIMFDAASNKDYLEGKNYIETEDNVKSARLTILEDKV